MAVIKKSGINLMLLITAFLSISLGLPASWAEPANVKSEPVELEAITVKGEAMHEADRAFSVNTISQDNIKAKGSASPITMIEEAPGAHVTAYQQGGVADVFQLRGFTGGGHGSDVGISLDGISLNEGESHADGYGDTNLIIPLELDSVTVYKGPVSPLYGNFARGGVVAFASRKGGEYKDFDFSMGSYGTYDTQGAVGMRLGKVQLNAAMQGYESEGWREHSRYTKMNGALRAAYEISGRSEVALSLRGHGGHWQAPGYVLWDQLEDEDRRRLQDDNVRTQQDMGDKQFSSQRLDFNQILDDKLKLLVSVYNTDHDFTRFQTGLNITTPSAVQQVEHNHKRSVQSLGASLNGRHIIAGLNSVWVTGFEYYNEETHSRRWNTSTHVRTSQIQDSNFINNTASLYGQMNIDINPYFQPNLGVRYDKFTGEQDNKLTGIKRDMNDFDHISPKLGVRSTLSEKWELRASAVNGFALPSGAAKFDPGINVDTVEYWQYEIGASGAPSSQWYLDMAVFVVDSSDEILEDPPGSGTFRNAGETRRNGIEGEVKYYPAFLNPLEFSATFGYYDSEIKDNPNSSLIGKKVNGAASYVSNIDVSYAPAAGLGGSIRLRSLGPWYANAANSVEYDGHNILSASVFYNFLTDNGKKTRLYLDMMNLTNEVYTEIASGGPHPTQGNVPTTTSPMPPLNVMAGITISL